MVNFSAPIEYLTDVDSKSTVQPLWLSMVFLPQVGLLLQQLPIENCASIVLLQAYGFPAAEIVEWLEHEERAFDEKDIRCLITHDVNDELVAWANASLNTSDDEQSSVNQIPNNCLDDVCIGEPHHSTYDFAFLPFGQTSIDFEFNLRTCEDGQIQAAHAHVWLADMQDKISLGSPENLHYLQDLDTESELILKSLLYVSVQNGWEEIGVVKSEQLRHVFVHPEHPELFKSISMVSPVVEGVIGIEYALWREEGYACRE